MRDIRLGLVGLGKIARDQHLQAIERTCGIYLAAVASRNVKLDGIASYGHIDDMLENCPLDAISLCTPPQGRYQQAVAALKANKHLILEKPPGATLSEVEDLITIAKERNLSLFATWHSRYASCVPILKMMLYDAKIQSVKIDWKEDVRRWHPGQQWIWQAGGLGVFDPGINALSIMTEVIPFPVYVTQSELLFPTNKDAPIAANLKFEGQDGIIVNAEFDWRQEGPQSWTIEIETEHHNIQLIEGGSRLLIDGVEEKSGKDDEYFNLYSHFVNLVNTNQSDVDLSPFRHVADAFMLGKHVLTAPFED